MLRPLCDSLCSATALITAHRTNKRLALRRSRNFCVRGSFGFNCDWPVSGLNSERSSLPRFTFMDSISSEMKRKSRKFAKYQASDHNQYGWNVFACARAHISTHSHIDRSIEKRNNNLAHVIFKYMVQNGNKWPKPNLSRTLVHECSEKKTPHTWNSCTWRPRTQSCLDETKHSAAHPNWPLT